MVALPGETMQQALETLRLNQQCHADLASCTLFIPYPRTKLADYAIEKGYFDGNFDHIPKSWTSGSPLRNPEKKKLHRFQRLFGIGVDFPWLMPLILPAIHIPVSALYAIISRLHWDYRFRTWINREKLTFPGMLLETFRDVVKKYARRA